MLYRKLIQTHKVYQRMRNFSHIPDRDWATKLVEWNISPKSINFDSHSQRLFYQPLGLSLVKDKHDFILNPSTLTQAKNLNKLADTSFHIDANDELILDIEGTQLIIETEQDLDIAYEIFVQGVYNFVYDKPVVVLDVGMNTGFASLFFAVHQNVVAVLGYEPFKITYEQALKNFALNPNLSSKIQPLDYGLGGQDEKILVEYDYNVKGSIGAEGIDNLFKNSDSKTLGKAELNIKGINEVFDSILAQYPGVDIVAKIDCEGSEYPIFDALNAKGQLNKIKIIMMEWHKKGAEPLVKHLKNSGFVSFSRLPRSKNVGMIYALRG